MHDIEDLIRLNQEIGEAESAGDKVALDRVLAPMLAFRRASGACVDRSTFLDGVKAGSTRETEIESITLLSGDRAVVTCTVSMEVEVNGQKQKKRFHNVRLFVRGPGGEDAAWKLLGWANEPV
jgi:hypothetical protein